MIVKNEIIKRIRESQDLRRELLYRMEWSEATMYRLLRDNAANGDLTKIAVLTIIAQFLQIEISEITEGD